MAAKNNIRSMRFSDDMIEIIDRQMGHTFTEKFENLVARCNWELPAQEKRLANIQDQIDEKRKQLLDLGDATRELEQFKNNLDNARRSFERVEASAKRIAEKCNTD